MKRLDTPGIIIKKEKLATFESPVALAELVLEEIEPYPGYYDQYHIPMDEKELIPKHLFLLTRGLDYFNDDDFIRITSRIKSETSQPFDARMGQLYLFNEKYNCIRIHTNYPGIIPGLIDDYKENGIQFIRTRTVKPYVSIIKIKSFFQLEEIQEGIYRHIRKPEVHFIVLPVQLDWDTFEHMTLSIRQNSDYKHYDAALAAAYVYNGMMEMVRIYDRLPRLDNLITLREKYLRDIRRIMA
jgi:hypothetical protein